MFVAFGDAGYDIIAFDGPGQGTVLEEYHILMTHEWEKPVNALIKQMMRKNLMIEWGLTQGMHVLGCDLPYDFLRKTVLFDTTDFSPCITQDVLLIAG